MNGEKLKNIREKKGYSRKELAERILVTEYVVQSWEEGWYITKPSSGEIEGLAEMFNLSEEELCNVLSIDIDDGYSEDDDIKLIDYIDSSVRAIQHVKRKK